MQQILQPSDRRGKVSVVEACAVHGRFEQERGTCYEPLAKFGQSRAHLLQEFDAGISWPDEAGDEYRRNHTDTDFQGPKERRTPRKSGVAQSVAGHDRRGQGSQQERVWVFCISEHRGPETNHYAD
jgi:hypothetical protein